MHHAVNDQYLDKNYGGVLVIWDCIFGSFKDESEPCVHGTRSPLNSWDPLWANIEVYTAIFQDAWHACGLDKLRVFIKPPGWRLDYLAGQFPKPAFDLAQMRKFEVPVSRSAAWLGGIAFGVMLHAVGLFLWFADTMSARQQLFSVAGLMLALWLIGAGLQNRIKV